MSHLPITSIVETDLGEEERALIRRHLSWVLENPSFSKSRRSQSFLRYIVEEALAGRAENIKERNIGVDVFGKSVDFDPQEESVVRVAAGEVRRRLQDAYEGGSRDGVRIELPVGCYSPKFNIAKTSTEAPMVTGALAPVTIRRNWPSTVINRRWGYCFTALLLCASAAGLLALRNSRSQQPLDKLWANFVGYKQQVLLALPSPSVLEARQPASLAPDDAANETSHNKPILRDGSYTGTGAGWGTAKFVEQLAVRRQQFRVGFGSTVSFADLSQSPAILLGGQTSMMGMQMTSGLRYKIVQVNNAFEIVDSRDSSKTWSTFTDPPPAETQEGYTLITFLYKSNSSYPVLVVAGLNPADTRAGAEFLTNNVYFREFAARAPKDWPEKNFQVILHDISYGGLPLKPTVVTWYVW